MRAAVMVVMPMPSPKKNRMFFCDWAAGGGTVVPGGGMNGDTGLRSLLPPHADNNKEIPSNAGAMKR